MPKIRSIIILLLLLLANSAMHSAPKPNPYNTTELNQVKQVSQKKIFVATKDGLKTWFKSADSIVSVGKHQNNYMVQIEGLKMKMHALQINDEKTEAESICKKILSISLENNNLHEYFQNYSIYCSLIMDRNTALAILEARKMVEIAKEHNYPQGVAWGYSVLGSANLFHRDDFYEAAESYVKAIDFAEKAGFDEEMQIQMLYVNLAKAYNEDHQFEKAEEALQHAERLSISSVDSLQTQLARLDLAYNMQVSTSAYNAIHETLFKHPRFDNFLTEDTQLFYYIRWLIMNHRYNEALHLTNKLEIPKDQHLMRADIYKATGDFRKFLLANDSLEQIRDSITHHLRMEEMVAIDGQLHNFELQEKTTRSRAQLYITWVSMIALMILLALVLMSIYNYRRNQHLRDTLLMNKKLKQANEVKTAFIRNMTHELNTPLNAINGFSEILSTTSPDQIDIETQHEMMQSIYKNGRLLSHIVEDIVLLTGYESATEQPSLDEFCPNELISATIESMFVKPLENIKIVNLSDLPEGYTIKSNGKMIRHLLENLLNNAAKFTKEGKIIVHSYLEDGNFIISVSDTGCGIPEGMEEKVFERFFKIDNFAPGTGLGLTLCRLICQKIGASISVDRSYKQKGTRFLFVLPE